jgi:hypothetical protein
VWILSDDTRALRGWKQRSCHFTPLFHFTSIGGIPSGPMNTASLDSRASVVLRLGAYVQERFPPVAYGLLVALFSGSALLLNRSLGDGAVGWDNGVPAAIVVLLVFFHLRVMDEHKDHEADRVAYPDRLLSRGVVTLRLLAKAAAVAVLLEGVLAATLGVDALLLWSGCFGFTVLMRIEFGFGAWLQRHLVCYAISHNPIVALLALFLWGASGAGWSGTYWLYVAAVSTGSLAFEIGRKLRLPAEEIDGVESYSSVLGRGKAAGLLVLIRLITVGLLAGLAWTLGGSLGPLLLLAAIAAVGFLPLRKDLGAKAVEGVASLTLLLDFVLVGWMAW